MPLDFNGDIAPYSKVSSGLGEPFSAGGMPVGGRRFLVCGSFTDFLGKVLFGGFSLCS